MRIIDLLSQNAVCLGASASGREEALDQERREAPAARANYQSAVRALEDVEGRWRQTRERLRALDGLEDRCRALLEEKRRRMAQSDPALGGRIRELEEKLAACRSMCREMEEAVRKSEAKRS